MAALTDEGLRAILAGRCGCGRRSLKVRALAPGRYAQLEGEPASGVVFALEEGTLAARAYRVECGECGGVLFSSEECPRCRAPARLSRALEGRSGLAPPAACPACDHPELTLTADLRMHAVFVEGRASRKVADAEPHEPGFHVLAAECPSCEATVAVASEASCAACGRSSLLKKIG